MNIESAYTDPELHDWIIRVEEYGSNFMRALAKAALVADIKHFNLLRPVLLKLKQEETRHATSSVGMFREEPMD